MARCAGVWLAGGAVEGGDEFAHGIADADALEIGQADRAMFSPAGARRMRKRQHGRERRRLILHQCDEAGGGRIQIPAQIMMRLENRPRRAIGADDLHLDIGAGPTPKTLPAG